MFNRYKVIRVNPESTKTTVVDGASGKNFEGFEGNDADFKARQLAQKLNQTLTAVMMEALIKDHEVKDIRIVDDKIQISDTYTTGPWVDYCTLEEGFAKLPADIVAKLETAEAHVTVGRTVEQVAAIESAKAARVSPKA